ncbi:MAG: NAD-dependent epimerase/dehydratase family protein [Planctomycetia bacterium]|nr:NAD-dependent epimerase/dehydratase family protein [Planctomycetia bacterium]
MTWRRVLVTGGAGFVGSHLCEALLRESVRVTILDNLSTGSWANCRHIADHPLFRAVIADAEDTDLVRREVAEHDFVFHLASAVGVRRIVDSPVDTLRTMVRATDGVFDACNRYRRPFLFTSSSEVYGKSVQIPFAESQDVTIGPTCKRRWAYACAKMLDEFLALAHCHESELPVRIVRLFNTVGPRQTGRYGMVLPRFVGQALRNEPLTVYGDGSQTRCFCDVRDVVRGLLAVAKSERTVGRVINLGTQDEISMESLAKRVIRNSRSASTIRYIPFDEAFGSDFDDMQRRVPDTSLVRTLCGWAPEISLDRTIGDIADTLRSPPLS